LQKIAKGTGIIFIGTIIGLLLGFVGRIILIRYITQTEYGIYSLALVIISIFATISTLGLGEGSTRYIAYFRGKNEEGKVRGVISSSIKIAIIASISLAIISFFISDFISVNIFHTLELSTPLKIFSFAIPFTVLINVFISIFRGFERVDARVYFQDILRPVLYLLFLIAVVLFGLSFLGVIYAYLASIAVTCVVFVICLMKKYPLSIRSSSSVTNPMTKELLFFSVPLLAVSMLMMVMSWTDTLMLGYFKTPDFVGLYNAALPLASLIPTVLVSINFLYVPIASELYAKDEKEEMKRNFAVLTKWVFLATLPIFFILFLFPDTILNLLFGSTYIGAAFALQILVLGFFLNPVIGPSYGTLTVVGKTRFLMLSFLISAIVNIVLNIVLIPPLGIIGAAIASALSLALSRILNAIKLYKDFKIHPFTKNYLKLVSLLVMFIIVFDILKNLFTVTFWMFLLLSLLFLIAYGLSILFTRSLDKEDTMMLLTIEKRLGVDLALVKKILKRFI
ncbi:MAG: oligosaccharide flippase family protein, partial [Methanophagales archaeon]|nr:oligosaccharide flippase family protein [Methanophagales archaeon]